MNQDVDNLLHNNYDIQQGAGYVDQHNEEPKKFPQFIAAITATLSALAAGVVLGWTSPILDELKNGNLNNIIITDSELGQIGSYVTLGAMTMCLVTGYICEFIGRRKTLLLSSLAFSLGRFISGMGVGMSCVAGPMYNSEIAHKSLRGTLGSYFQLMITIGIFLAYFIGKFLPIMYFTLTCSVFPLIFVTAFGSQPESPIYLLKRNLPEQAKTVLMKLRGNDYDVDEEITVMEESLKESVTVSQKATKKAFVIAFALMFFQQFSGINTIILYTSDIFSEAGLKLDPKTASIIVGAFQAIATFISSLVIEKLGRRPLLLNSTLVLALSNFILALYFSLKDRVHVSESVLDKLGFMPVGGVCLFVVVFSLGLGPIPWMLSSEIFTPQVKSSAVSLAGAFNWFLAYVITRWFLDLNNLIGSDSTYYMFAVFSLIGAVFVYFIVPETKGKTIGEIQEELGN